MPVLLVIVLVTLLSGLLLVSFLAWYRPWLAGGIGAIIMTIVLTLWVIAGRNLPLSPGQPEPASSIPWPQFVLQVDKVAWQLSFYVLLLVVALFVVMASHLENDRAIYSWPQTSRFLTPAIFFITIAILLTLWAGTFSGLVISWALLAASWILLLGTASRERIPLSTLIRICVILLVGMIFLGMAAGIAAGITAVTSGTMRISILTIQEWPSAARTWALLAALWFLGVLPFHWWRPLKWASAHPVNALIFIVPAISGSSLFVRIALNAGNGGYELFLTMLGLLSMLIGAILAWINLQNAVSMVAGLSLAQAGVITLVGSWAGPEAIAAEAGVMALGVGGMFLLASLSGGSTAGYAPWFGIVYLAAMAGVPLTLGFVGRAPLYDAWQGLDRLVLLLVSGLILMLVIAAGISFGWRNREMFEKRTLNILHLQLYVVLFMLAIGLLMVPGFSLAGVSLLTWLTILFSVAGSMVLSRFGRQVVDIHNLALRSFHIQLYLAPIRRFTTGLGAAISRAIRDATAILEGEGGMLWLIVLVIILWLARRG